MFGGFCMSALCRLSNYRHNSLILHLILQKFRIFYHIKLQHNEEEPTNHKTNYLSILIEIGGVLIIIVEAAVILSGEKQLKFDVLKVISIFRCC